MCLSLWLFRKLVKPINQQHITQCVSPQSVPRSWSTHFTECYFTISLRPNYYVCTVCSVLFTNSMFRFYFRYWLTPFWTQLHPPQMCCIISGSDKRYNRECDAKPIVSMHKCVIMNKVSLRSIIRSWIFGLSRIYSAIFVLSRNSIGSLRALAIL